MKSHKNVPYSTSHRTTVLTIREGEDDAAQAALALQAKIDTAVDAAVKGLKSKNEELLGKIKASSDKLKDYEGFDPKALKALQETLENDEDIKLITIGKKTDVILKYTERMRIDHATNLEALHAQIKVESDRADGYKERVLDNQIRTACSPLHKNAIDDALLHARNIFSLDAKGNAVQLDSEGRPVLGKDGTSPFSPSEWIESQKASKPHWFPISSSGGGGGGARDAGSFGSNFTNLSATERLTAARAQQKK